MPHAETAGVILAGGRSSRMGRDKAQLPWRGVRLVDHVAQVMRQAGLPAVYISGEIEGYSCIPDPEPHCGPVGGLIASVLALRNRHAQLIFVPVDMPLLGAEILNALLDFPDEAEAHHFLENPLPCAVRLSEPVIAHSLALRSTPDCAVHRYLGGINTVARPIPAEWAEQLRNTNTPEEWAAVCTEQGAYT